MEGNGDWNEQLNDYCPTSGLRMDRVIEQIINAGFDIHDLKNLERLSDPVILNALPMQKEISHSIVKMMLLNICLHGLI
jgi:hypothetical protein